jgi:HD-GYP domain-containing protein (c-di-GMP phosphodiesterase class II)
MISDRPYRKAMSPEAALRELEKNADQQFELRVVGTLVEATKQVRTSR